MGFLGPLPPLSETLRRSLAEFIGAFAFVFIGAGAVLTFFLVWAFLAMPTDARLTYTAIAALAIGLTVTVDMLFGNNLTGAMMNPARAFGPQLVGNSWSGWGSFWIWYVGPFAG